MVLDVIQILSLMVQNYGYLGVFLVHLIDYANTFMPFPAYIFSVPFLYGHQFNPVIVAVAASLGAAIGALFGYVFGIGLRNMVSKRNRKIVLDKILKFLDGKAGFLIVMAVTFLPEIPIDVVSVFIGTIGYKPKKYFTAFLAGAFVKYLTLSVLVYNGNFGLLNFFLTSEKIFGLI
jgi:membrane protein YqaA with SNARE-associated domain